MIMMIVMIYNTNHKYTDPKLQCCYANNTLVYINNPLHVNHKYEIRRKVRRTVYPAKC